MEHSSKEAKKNNDTHRSSSRVAEMLQHQEFARRPYEQPANDESGNPKSTTSTQPTPTVVTYPALCQRTKTHTAPRNTQQGTSIAVVPSLDQWALRIERLRHDHEKFWWDESRALVRDSSFRLATADTVPIAMLSQQQQDRSGQWGWNFRKRRW